jgi:hypothetical protein
MQDHEVVENEENRMAGSGYVHKAETTGPKKGARKKMK